MRNILMIASAATVFAQTAAAQDAGAGQGDPETQTINRVRPDLLVPTSPAFSILGVTPEEVIRPTTPKTFATSLLNGLDANGNLQTGFAVDFSPYYAFMGQNITLGDYRAGTFGGYLTRVLTRSQVSAAIAQGLDDEDEATRASIGLRVNLVGFGDPRMAGKAFRREVSDGQFKTVNLDDCYRQGFSSAFEDLDRQRAQALNRPVRLRAQIAATDDQIAKAKVARDKWVNLAEAADVDAESEYRSRAAAHAAEIEALEAKMSVLEVELANARAVAQAMAADEEAGLDLGAARDEADAAAIEAWEQCNADFAKSAWNATDVSVGVAASFTSEEGDLADLGGAGFAAYGTIAYGFEGVRGLEDTAQLILHGRYQTNVLTPVAEVIGMTGEEMATTGADTETLMDMNGEIQNFVEQDLTIAGAQLRIAGPDFGAREGGRDIAFFFEIDYRRAETDGFQTDETLRYAGGVEAKLGGDFSIKLLFGEETNEEFDIGGTFISSNLSLSF